MISCASLAEQSFILALESATVQHQPAWLDQQALVCCSLCSKTQCWQAMHNMVMHVVTLVCS